MQWYAANGWIDISAVEWRDSLINGGMDEWYIKSNEDHDYVISFIVTQSLTLMILQLYRSDQIQSII